MKPYIYYLFIYFLFIYLFIFFIYLFIYLLPNHDGGVLNVLLFLPCPSVCLPLPLVSIHYFTTICHRDLKFQRMIGLHE